MRCRLLKKYCAGNASTNKLNVAIAIAVAKHSCVNGLGTRPLLVDILLFGLIISGVCTREIDYCDCVDGSLSGGCCWARTLFIGGLPESTCYLPQDGYV